jgi:hypothetical protein
MDFIIAIPVSIASTLDFLLPSQQRNRVERTHHLRHHPSSSPYVDLVIVSKCLPTIVFVSRAAHHLPIAHLVLLELQSQTVVLLVQLPILLLLKLPVVPHLLEALFRDHLVRGFLGSRCGVRLLL